MNYYFKTLKKDKMDLIDVYWTRVGFPILEWKLKGNGRCARLGQRTFQSQEKI